MCLVLGFMISLAWVTQENRRSRLGLISPEQSRRIGEASVDPETFQELTNEVSRLRAEKTKLENALAGNTNQAKVLNDSLQEAKKMASLTDLVGPGIVVTLRDSGRASPDDFAMNEAIVHDTDVLRVVNELFSAGAEGVSVNDHRVGPRTAFRCVGPTILVNDVKIASPVEIRAIGDAKTLLGAMNLPGGILAEIRQADPGMVTVEKSEKLTIKAYTGSTDMKVATVPPAPKEPN